MTSQQWDLYKSEIERLYIHESKTLAEVMSYMAVQYSWHKRYVLDGFPASQLTEMQQGTIH